jgi:hypothetical protein
MWTYGPGSNGDGDGNGRKGSTTSGTPLPKLSMHGPKWTTSHRFRRWSHGHAERRCRVADGLLLRPHPRIRRDRAAVRSHHTARLHQAHGAGTMPPEETDERMGVAESAAVKKVVRTRSQVKHYPSSG